MNVDQRERASGSSAALRFLNDFGNNARSSQARRVRELLQTASRLRRLTALKAPQDAAFHNYDPRKLEGYFGNLRSAMLRQADGMGMLRKMLHPRSRLRQGIWHWS